MKKFKIYFKTNRTINNERCTNVTFVEMENIKDATLYAMKTFGDDFIEVIQYTPKFVKYPTKKRNVQWYIKEIQRLEEIDKQITLKVQHQLNVMDQKERCHGR